MLLWMIYSVAASVLIVLLVRAAQQALESVSGVVPVAWSPGAAAMAVTLLVAALWQGLPLKRRIERASYSPRPFPLHGIAADAAIVRFGLTHGAQCVAACWPLMLVGPAVGSFAWMVAMAALVWIEKTQRYASRLKQPSALVLAAASVFYILAALN